MRDAITDVFTDVIVLLPVLIIVGAVVVGLISWAAAFFSPKQGQNSDSVTKGRNQAA